MAVCRCERPRTIPDVIDEKDILVPTRDGGRVAVRVYRPSGPGRFPALFAASPYRYDNDDMFTAMYRWRETGPISWYVEEQGYAYVHADVVGTGLSDGHYRFLDRAERRAHYDVVEWIAEQPWSSGKIGGIGQSYYCMSQWLAAIERPPHLTCIAAYDGMIDPYSGAAFSNGIEKAWLPGWFNGSVRLANSWPANGARPRELAHDIAYEALQHPLYDDFWRERSAIERIHEIDIPVFSIGVWAKQELHLAGNIVGYQRVSGPKKLFISGAASGIACLLDFNEPSFHEEFLLPFYDRYLKGIPTSYDDRPQVEYAVRNTTERRSSPTWPPADIQRIEFFLNSSPSRSLTSLNDGSLDAAEHADGSTSYTYPDPQWTWGVATNEAPPDPVKRILTFTTAPLDYDLELTGSAKLVLFASTTAHDMDFVVRISDQSAQSDADRAARRQPKATIVSKGWLRASHRQKDARWSTDDVPVYSNTSLLPVEPGAIYELEVPLQAMAYRFRAGSRLRLEIANHDSPQTDGQFMHYYKPSKIGTDTIYHDRRHRSRLIIPVLSNPSQDSL